jgi:hypothetical protein
MSTELLEMTPQNGVSVTRFYGGQVQGVCYQLTTEDGRFIQLTIPQLTDILKSLADSGVDIGWAWRNS